MIEIVFKLDENKAIAYDSEKKVGECDFEEIDDIWNITHTEVDSDYQGQGIARKLVENVIENSQKYNKKITAKAVKENNMKSTAFDMAMVAYRQNDMESAFRQFLSLAEAYLEAVNIC